MGKALASRLEELWCTHLVQWNMLVTPSICRWGKKIPENKCSRKTRILSSPLTSLNESMVAAAQEREESLVPIVVFMWALWPALRIQLIQELVPKGKKQKRQTDRQTEKSFIRCVCTEVSLQERKG